MRRTLWIATTALALLACPSQRETTLRSVEDGLVRYVVAPQRVEAATAEFLDPHYAFFDPGAPRDPRLLVVLPGSRSAPENAQALLVVAARAGLHAIGLQYNNSPSLKRLCPDGDPECFDRARLDIVYGGGDRVDRPHSIEHRLAALLAWLAREYGEEGWGSYLDDGLPHWSRIALAGHSQGGSHVGLIARRHVVDRAILFGNSPSWIDAGHRTPLESYFVFFHWADHGDDRLAACERFGLLRFGEPADVDRDAPAFDGSHLLITRIPIDKPHPSVFLDAHLPDGQGDEPRFATAWRYLLGVGE